MSKVNFVDFKNHVIAVVRQLNPTLDNNLDAVNFIIDRDLDLRLSDDDTATARDLDAILADAYDVIDNLDDVLTLAFVDNFSN
jgi:hypothetical protein